MIEPCNVADMGAEKIAMIDIEETEKLRIEKVTALHVVESIKTIKPSTNPEEMLQYIQFTHDYGECDRLDTEKETTQDMDKKRKHDADANSADKKRKQ